jgi:hypothetical protein
MERVHVDDLSDRVGHEIIGRVMKVGSAVTEFMPGDLAARWAGYAERVLQSRPFQRQNVSPDYFLVFRCGRGPVFPGRTPGITKALLIRISILRNDSCDSVRVGHRQTEAGWGARALRPRSACAVSGTARRTRLR